MVIAHVALLLAFALVSARAATAQEPVEIGYVTSFDGKQLITASTFAYYQDLHFADGSPSDGENTSNSLIILNQCYAGNWLPFYNQTTRDQSAGGADLDLAAFTNTTVLAANAPGKITKYTFACELTANLFRFRTAQDVHDLTSACKSLTVDHTPQIQGSGTRAVGGSSSTHVLVWASQPDLQRDLHHIERIVQRFAPTATTTVTVLSGDGTPAQTGTQAPGVTYGPATRTALNDAYEAIGARMDDGADEQFILFVLDHGGKARIDSRGQVVPVFEPPVPGARSFTLQPDHELLAAIRENAASCNPPVNPGCEPHLSIFTPLEPGVDFDLADLNVWFQRPGQPAVSLPLGPANVFTSPFGGTAYYQLRLPLAQDILFGSSPGMVPRDGIPYTVTVQNWSPVTPFPFDVTGIFSGAIPKKDAADSDYAQVACGNPPMLGCSDPSLAYFRMNEPSGAGGVLDYVSGAMAIPVNFGNVPGSELGAPGPQPPLYPGLEIGNRAPYFDGLDDWMTALASGGGRSITGLVKPDIAAAGTIVSKSGAFLLATDPGGKLEFTVWQGGQDDPLHKATIQSSEPLPLDVWTHFTASVGEEGMGIWLNGREMARRTYGVPTALPDNDAPLWIGTGFDGQIDELAFSSTAFAAPQSERMADLILGEISSAFDLPVTGNGGVKVGTNSTEGIEVGPFDDSGVAFVSFDVSSANVLQQGFNFRVNADLLHILRNSIGVGVGGTTGLGFASITAIGQNRGGLVADFRSLGDSMVTATVLRDGGVVGSFTVPAGAIATVLPLVPPELLSVLDGTNRWGFGFKLPSAAVFTPVGGGASFTGDEIRFTAPNFARASLPPIAIVDVGGFNIPKFEILDAGAGPLPDPVAGDADRNGVVDFIDFFSFLQRLGDRNPDLDGDGVITMRDLRLFIGVHGAPSLPLAGATAAPLAAPLLALQTATPAVQVGQPVALDLVLSGLTGTVGGLALEVRYDAAAFALDDVSFGNALGSADDSLDHSIEASAQSAVFAFDTPGVVQLYVLSLLDAAQLAALQSGTLALARLDFTALAPAAAQFDAAAVDMADGAQPPVDLAPLTQGVQVQVTCANGDGDALCNTADNCPFFATANVADTDGDGRGDACECTDQNGDGRNTVSDLIAINLAIFNPSLVTPLCDGTGDGLCNVNDIIAANVEIFSPTNTSICARQPTAGP
jgi:hypothetical protein